MLHWSDNIAYTYKITVICCKAQSVTEVQTSKPKSAEVFFSHGIMVAIGMVVIDTRPYTLCGVSMHGRKKKST